MSGSIGIFIIYQYIVQGWSWSSSKKKRVSPEINRSSDNYAKFETVTKE